MDDLGADVPDLPFAARAAARGPTLSQKGQSNTMANLPPLPPAGRAPQGGQNAGGGKSNPKDARAGTKHTASQKKGGVSKATQSNRKQGDR